MANEVAVAAEAGLPANMDFLNTIAESEQGEALSRDDVSIPFLRILQKLSPQCDEDDDRYVEGARPGMILNTVTGEMYPRDAKIEFIPIMYKASFIEWVPRNDGGGMVREYPLSVGKPVSDEFTERDDNNNDVIQKGAPEPFTVGNHLLFTHTHVVRYRVNGGAWKSAVISMTKSQLKTSRTLNALIQDNPVGGKAIRFLHLMTASTQLVSKGEDKWFIWHFAREGFADQASISEAQEFRKAVMTGDVKVDMTKSIDDDDFEDIKPKKAKPVDELDEEVPF